LKVDVVRAVLVSVCNVHRLVHSLGCDLVGSESGFQISRMHFANDDGTLGRGRSALHLDSVQA
jgi:hypothetical protein